MDRIGVVGAGTMGAGIAQGAAVHGYAVQLHDRDRAVVERAVAQIQGSLGRAVAKGKMTQADADAAVGRIRPCAELPAFCDCGLVVEAIVESPAAKRALFADLSVAVPDYAVIATNTSSLRVGDLADAVRRPERFLGLHYFFPAAVNPLVEVVRGPATSDDAVAAAFAFAKRCGKTPIGCRDQFGFAVNRFFVPYLNEAARLADEGFDIGAVDAVARASFETAAGPFRVMDLTKPAIALHAARTLAQLGAFYAPAPGLVRIGECGDSWKVAEDAPVPLVPETIRDRLQGAVLFAVLQELDEQVASPADLDRGARLGLQWGWQPCAFMEQAGRERVEALVAPVAARHGVAVPRPRAR